MQEIGLESSLIKHIIDGNKTIELRLGKPRFLKLRKGMQLSLREDVWQDGKIVESYADRASVVIKQILYFESFEEAFGAVSYKAAVPEAESIADAIATYRQFYSAADEYEYGVMVMTIEVI